MKRVVILGVGVLAAIAAGAAVSRAFRAPPPPPPPPNIVVVVWDTTRADRLSAYGYARETSPWLASVARDGVLFEQCRAPSPWTLPSHASLLTGLLPRHHGASEMNSALGPGHETLAEVLSASGYDTILVSANALVGHVTGLGQGFAAAVEAWEDPRGARASTVVDLLDRELERRARDPGRAARPVFVFLNFIEPHLPYDPPLDLERPWRAPGVTDDEVARARKCDFDRGPAKARRGGWMRTVSAHNLGIARVSDRDIAILSSLYDADVRDLDRSCVELEKLLRGRGVLREADPATGAPGTLLVVTSDHGENLGEEGLLDHKLSVSDALLHVPLVLRWPGRLPAGRRVRESVRLQDVFPTVLEAAGVPAGPPLAHAESLLRDPVRARTVFAEYPAPLSFLGNVRSEFPGEPEARFEPLHRGLVAVIAPSLRKAVMTRRHRGDAEPPDLTRRLYDLAADPSERTDLLAGGDAAARAEFDRLLAEGEAAAERR